MNRVSKIPLLTLLCVLVASATPAQAKMEKLEETVVMSDGTGLDARIFKPEGAGAWPALLVRTPYSSESAGDALVWVDAGAVFVKQNVRGQGLSDGEFCLMLCDGQDGVETIDWITRQSWSNAEVVMVGNSVKSDVLPVIGIGGRAIHVPHTTTWALEEPDPVAAASAEFPVADRLADVAGLLAAWPTA